MTLLGLYPVSKCQSAASTKATEAAAASATVLLCHSAVPDHSPHPWEKSIKAHMRTPSQNRPSASSEASQVTQNKASKQQNSQQWGSSGGCSLCEAWLLSSWECTVTQGWQRQLLLSSPSFRKNYISSTFQNILG